MLPWFTLPLGSSSHHFGKTQRRLQVLFKTGWVGQGFVPGLLGDTAHGGLPAETLVLFSDEARSSPFLAEQSILPGWQAGGFFFSGAILSSGMYDLLLGIDPIAAVIHNNREFPTRQSARAGVVFNETQE